MNLEIMIEELSLPYGINASEINDQIAEAIHGQLSRSAAKLFRSSNVLEMIGDHVANATENHGVEFLRRNNFSSVLD